LALVHAMGGTVHACIDSDPVKSGTDVGNGVRAMTPIEFDTSSARHAFVIVSSTHAAEIERQLEAMSLSRRADYLTLDSEVMALAASQER
jgi:hypothetical protein